MYNLRAKLLEGGVLLFVGKGSAQLCTFLRNVIVARVIGVDNFGIAATFSITIAFLEMVGSLSVDKLLIQAKDGNDERFQSVAHAIQALRGILSGMLIAMCAWPMAQLFGVPQAVWAFRYLAVVSILRGFVHLDQQRVQRDMNYRAAVSLEVAQQLIPTLIAWPLAIWLRDYSSMLWLLVVQSAIATGGSFLLARRPYRWRWDRNYVRRFLSFGWPLIINNVLLFGVFQGDRFLIGAARQLFGSNAYSLRDLGVYSVAMALTLTPVLALSNISSSLMLPLFARVQTEPTELGRQYDICAQVVGLLSGLFALPLIIAGGWIVTVVYGAEYGAAGAFIGWLAAMQAVRMARLTPTMAAMAAGDTTNAMYSNMIRSLALLGAICVIAVGGPLKWIAMCGFLGEVLGLIVCLWKLKLDHRIPALSGAKPAAVVMAYMALAAVLATYLPASSPHLLLGLVTVLPAVFVATMFYAFPSLRSYSQMLALRSSQADTPRRLSSWHP